MEITNTLHFVGQISAWDFTACLDLENDSILAGDQINNRRRISMSLTIMVQHYDWSMFENIGSMTDTNLFTPATRARRGLSS